MKPGGPGKKPVTKVIAPDGNNAFREKTMSLGHITAQLPVRRLHNCVSVIVDDSSNYGHFSSTF